MGRRRNHTDTRQYLVALRAAERPHDHPDMDLTRRCAQCREPVVIYPSGHTLLRRYPHLTIVCRSCRQTSH